MKKKYLWMMAAITLHSYCEAIKANKGITDEQV